MTKVDLKLQGSYACEDDLFFWQVSIRQILQAALFCCFRLIQANFYSFLVGVLFSVFDYWRNY